LTDAISKRLLDRFYLFCPSIDISKFIQSALFLKGTRNTGADKADVIARAAQYERNRIAGNPPQNDECGYGSLAQQILVPSKSDASGRLIAATRWAAS
jgi:hypothetical protein